MSVPGCSIPRERLVLSLIINDYHDINISYNYQRYILWMTPSTTLRNLLQNQPPFAVP